MKQVPNRRPCITTNVGAGMAVTVSFCPRSGEAIEVFMSQRGKASDNELTEAMYNLGVTASKLMQGEFDEAV
ncbi:MAG: hypothetical protein ACPGQQ_08610 [Candidatus Puniceispirillaceae bacterium]|jgi:hypothetical protein